MIIIEQIYTGCLAQGAYYIQSENEVAIIDPLREVKPYVARADAAGAKIKYVFETHFHADFVSGHLDLAKQTGATIIYGPEAQPGYPAYISTDNEEFTLGKVRIRVLHTPGHTMESACYLLLDEDGTQTALFSGDTLFIGDVGRPDLAQKANHLTQEDLAGLLFDSLRSKVMTLDNDVVVYPAHGAGSACGKNMSKETTDTLGNQKKFNYALREDMTRDEFIAEVTRGLSPPPAYFPMNVKMNKEGYASIDAVLTQGTLALLPEAFETAANETNAVILDTRDPEAFQLGHIPGAINIGLNGSFAPWVGALITDIKQPLLIIADEGREEEVVTRLARVGYDHAMGYLKGGIDAWKTAGKDIDSVISITADELADVGADATLIDVRKDSEYNSAHIVGAHNFPLDYINNNMGHIDKNKPVYVHCAGGYRSMVFVSILKARGFDNLINVAGGFGALKESGKFNISYDVYPTTLL